MKRFACIAFHADCCRTELLPRGACFADLEAARLELAEYLAYYYNTLRLHSDLGHYTPLEIELHYRFNLALLGVHLHPTTSTNGKGRTVEKSIRPASYLSFCLATITVAEQP